MIREALQSAAMRLVSRKPDVFFGSSETLEMELCDLVNEVAQDVAKYQDWQALVALAEVTGDGNSVFDLPDDYDRQLLDADVQTPPSVAWGYRAYTNINTFLRDEAGGYAGYPGGWIIYGNKVRFAPAPQGTAVYPYITKNIVLDENGVSKPAFTQDSDSFVLPERLLTLGVVWRWRENKRLDASGDQEAFIKALDEYGAKDSGSKILRFGRSRMMGYPAYSNIVRG